MPSLKDLKNRIGSVKNTRKITKAMQMVAAAKLRRAQDAAEAARPYADRMAAVMAGLTANAAGQSGAPRLLAGTGDDKRHLLVVMTAERGLAGGFNSSIVRLARQHADRLRAEGKDVAILTVGKKGREQLKRDYGSLFVHHVDLSEVKRMGYDTARAIADEVLTRFDTGDFDVATIFYNRFESVISQVPTARQIIPAEVPEGASETNALYDYEPGEEELLADLLPRSVATQIFAALLENAASEQGARMSAMDNATRNAGDMIDRLTTQYNRSRQAAITTELIEIIAGAEAL
ncbi:ATP synthase subunit gamma [Paracoccus sp. S4493]|jgi:F-type H+-transporting ATPase subunit gamma|uniref:ATP synthase gamma chain n=2 Tax=root TaxID=1 RepID=A0ABY7USP0_9RHOB|nr:MULTISPECIES: F0F1 ATP synthase subunit gamma [Paracoccus]TYP62767.1 ATP synthase F1 subcomplex gamma subunit [Stutzerimonas stutzeri]AZY94716.1 F0F1 ATP synthase subunit gamma [Paracoccus sp. Arc7-R13]KIX17167.1 ATP synthase subunit gamma [Paracoccus sp. 228]KJZ30914.1 ATP synthase subunit gamma [Paracoccus sp. S4493]MCO6363223.1 F0F1 ATP synthase subunit gamma [Paracoccus sp. 08]|tara:strand:+ start:6585 stop:7457 length:873 start_codon:yes stop_codon:yes gene_type:complete